LQNSNVKEDFMEAISGVEERFDKFRRTLGLFLGPSVFFLLLLLPMSNISSQAHKLAAILGFVMVYWICEPIPLPVTAILGTFLTVAFGIAKASEAFSSYSAPIIFLFIGSFILAQAMKVYSLDQRFAFTILSTRWISAKPSRILFACGIVSWLTSMWIMNTTTTAMLFPIIMGILSTILNILQSNSKGLKSFRYGTGILLMIPYAASIGGLATPIGTAPNLIGIGMIQKLGGVNITFFQWSALIGPISALMYLILFAIIVWLYPLEVKELPGFQSYIKEKKGMLIHWNRGEINTLSAFILAVSLWIFPGFLSLIYGVDSHVYNWWMSRFPEEVVALIAATLLFILPIDWKNRQFTLSWRQAVDIDWGTILLFGGGLSLGSLMFKTKLAETLGHALVELMGFQSLWGITALAIILSLIITETTSNTATVSVVVPIMIAVAKSAGISPIPPALGACVAASLAFMLPVSTPPNAIAYGSGMIPILSMIKTGIILDSIGIFVVWISLRILCPLFGLI